ncbi:MAG: hypothetical protein K6G28_01190 [Acholeplasmatales bacterium]|nr:hypothetical protein [Acholeplasmatales bacterium]
MKKRLSFIFITLSLLAVAVLSSCKVFVSSPLAVFENLNYTSDDNTVTFDLTITDSDSIGSNYKINLYNQSSSTVVNTLGVDTFETTNYSFNELESDTNYTLYVTCTYGSLNDTKIKSTATFSTKGTSVSYLSGLNIDFLDKTIAYDGDQHYLYATDSNGNELKSEYMVSLGGTAYIISYDSTNSFSKEPGKYTYKINVYQTNSFNMVVSSNRTLVETKSATLTITKGNKIFDFNDSNYQYTGKSYEVPFTYDGLSYEARDNDGNVISLNDVLNPGVYTIYYSFAGNNYYNALNGSYTVTITKANITSTLESQIAILTDSKASLNISDDSFSVPVSSEDLTITYYDSNDKALDTDYVTEAGTYKVIVKVNGNDKYNDYEIVLSLQVYNSENDLEQDNPIIISNLASFSIETSSRMSKSLNYYEYVQLYNNTNVTVNLSQVELEIDGYKVYLTGSLKANETTIILLYNNSKTVSMYMGFFSQNIDLTDLADQSFKVSNITGVNNINLKIFNYSFNYIKNNKYDDFTSSLKGINGNTLTYDSRTYTDLSSILNAIKGFKYTSKSPVVTFNFDGNTISETRKNDLIDKVTAQDGFGNNITITNEMVDMSNVTLENVGKEIDVNYSIVDNYGNKVSITKKFTMVDEEAPVIDITNISTSIELNSDIDLTKYFVVTDNVDGNIVVTKDMIDSTKLDLSTEGIYKITLNVSDAYNNKASKSIYLRVGVDYAYLSDFEVNDTIKNKDTGEGNAMPSTGNVKVLVVPLKFSESTNETNTPLSKLSSAFNGDLASKNFESVKAYYQTASYGKLNLSFEVYPSWIDVSSLTNERNGIYSQNIATNAIVMAMQTVSKTYDLSDYDSDNDGYVDAVWFVYDINYSSGSSIQWAWTSDYESQNITYNSKTVGKICFASYAFTNSDDKYYQGYSEYGTNSITARTYIHETGHLLGLNDYYDYDYNQTVGVHHTMYGITLMDSNYGDLDAASKLMLGWIDPIVVSSNDIVTIGSTALSSKNAVLISKTIETEKTIFTRYILLEFWTNDGLNKVDASNTFGVDKYGVRVLYVDAEINYVDGVATLTNGKRPSYFKYNNTDDDSRNFVQTLAKDTNSIYNSITAKYNTIDTVLFNDTNITF